MKNHSINIAVVLNGPPGCGKDTIANVLVNPVNGHLWPMHFAPFVKHQFKDALYEHTAKHFEVGLDEFIHFASDRELKDSKSLAGLGGRTPRQALIHVSEDIYKPRFGIDYFGKVEALRVSEHKGRLGGVINVIYPDGGFESEIPPIESEFDLVIIIRLHRDGFDFKGDSRNYLNLPDTETRKTVDEYLVDGKIEDGVWKVRNWIERIIWNLNK